MLIYGEIMAITPTASTSIKELKEIRTIHRRFDEAVLEIKQLLQQRKELIPHPLIEGVGAPIETFAKGYGETVAEIHRLELIKTLSGRFK